MLFASNFFGKINDKITKTNVIEIRSPSLNNNDLINLLFMILVYIYNNYFVKKRGNY